MKRVRAIVQLAIGVALVSLLFWKMKDRSDVAAAVVAAMQHWLSLTIGLLALGLSLGIAALRWHILLQAQGFTLSLSRTCSISFVGHFFNCFLLGSTGGDVVKAMYAAGETDSRKAEAVATIAIDRIVGLFALMVLVVVVMLLRLDFFLAHGPTRIALLFFSALLVTGLAGLFVVFHRDAFERWALFRRLEQRTRFGSLLARVYKAFQIVIKQPQALIKALLLSVAVQLCIILSGWMMGRALEIQLPFREYMTILPSVNAVAAIPVTPGGLGTRETAARFLFGVLGVPATRSVLLSLLIYAGALFWGLVGGAIYLRDSVTLARVTTPPSTNGDCPTSETR